mgnify:CR=1 FL=1
MPNWTDTHLVILVPRANLEALKADISGPRMWHYPTADVNGGEFGHHADKLSNHQKIEIDNNADELIAQFRALPCNADRPDWMPVSRMDVEAMLIANGKLGEDIEPVPFSIPKLRPWEDRFDFDRLFPGQMDGPYWNVAEEARRSYNSGSHGSLRLCNFKLGCKWPPSEVRLADEDTMNDEDVVDLHIRYQTPWSPVSDFSGIVWDVLKKHSAKALLIWEEEDCNSGFDYVNPGENRSESDDFGQELAFEEEDEEGYDVRGIDRERLADRAISGAEDDDFHGLF